MGLLKLLFGKRKKSEDGGDPADNPYSDDDDFSFRDREAARLGDSQHREADRDTVDEMRRETDDE
jgi:hypothetical protein